MSETEPRFVYELQEGETWRIFKHLLIIAHPDNPPFAIDIFTNERLELKPDALPSQPSEQ